MNEKKKSHETNPTEIYEPVKNPSEINKKLMEIHTHIINGDYDCLEENIEIAGINPKQGKYLMKNILNKVKQNLLIIQLQGVSLELF